MYNLEMKDDIAKDNLFETTIFPLRANDSFFMEYWFAREKELYDRFSKFLNTPVFTAGELPVSYRVLNHWGEIGILPEGIKNNGTWRKFTFVERIWIYVAVQLRDFGFPLEKIVAVRKHILKYNKKFKAYFFFEHYIAKGLSSEDDPYVAVLSNGVADVGSQRDIELNKLLGGSQDMLLISLKNILKTLGHEVKKSAMLLNLNNDEVELFREINSENNDEISINLKGGKITETKLSKTHAENPNLKSIINDIEKNADFAEVTMKCQKGKVEMVKVIKKRRSSK